MARINKEREELGKQDDLFTPDIHNSCSQLERNISDRRKVFDFIFEPNSSSESFNTDESSYSTYPNELVTVSDSNKKLPIRIDLKNISPNGEAKLEVKIKKEVRISNVIGSDERSVEENYIEANENVVSNTQDSDLNYGTYFDGTKEMDGFLSPEEKDAVSQLALSQIAHKLDKHDNLEKEGTRLYTGPYGRIHSPFKKYSSFHGFPSGVKRSPRKVVGPAAKRTKLFHTGNSESSSSSASLKNKTPDKNIAETRTGNVGSGDDSSDDDQWEIVEEDLPTEIDQALDDKSSKFSLSVMNVKSIIHKIITNESVVEMVRKAVLEEMDEQELKFEPKMTRSKLKEFEAQGQVPLNWGLSPRKKRESPNFLEMELPDDEEEDEDFTPTMTHASDEDSESVQSLCYSDIGSPMPSTPQSMPSTPQSMSSTKTVISNQSVHIPRQADDDPSTHVEEKLQNFLSPMGPPLQTLVRKSGGLGKKFQDSMERDKQQSEQEAELIASRTRSKFPMKDCSILDIEASFVAPDITHDMYDTCDDLDWAEFLSTLITFPDDIKTNNLNTTNEEEDTEDDPEYNFQEEIDTLEYDREDFRDDRAVKVSKKEMNMLLDDVLNNDEDYDKLDEQYKIKIKTQSEKIVFNSNKKKQTQYQQSLISAIGEHERKQIDDQLRKHVQQLAQTYVMSQNGIAEHKPMGNAARFYLNELKTFAEKSEKLYGVSAYRASNLDMAICVVDDHSWQQEVEVPTNIKERMESLIFKHDSLSLPAFSYGQMLVMWTSPVFMFPELLPHGGFFKQVDVKRDRARVKFLESEDNLLAMGVAQFSHLKKDAKDYLQRFMLPCKSRKQIEIRIKNLSAKASKDNTVKFFRKYKRLPRFPQHAPEFDISMLKSLKESHHDWAELPLWCRFFCADDDCVSNESVRNLLERQKEIKRRRKERQSVSFTLSELDIASMLMPSHSSKSAPITPHQDTNSSVSGSSGSESDVILCSAKRKRPRLHSKKKLNMNKQKKNDMGIVGSFVPLPLPGSSIPQPQSSTLAICVVDNSGMQNLSPVHNTASPCLGSLPGKVDASCKKPTILVINKNATMQQQNLNPAVTPNLSFACSQSATPFTNTSTQVPLSMPLTGTENCNNESDIDTKSLTFEDICRPIMEAEMAEDITEKEIHSGIGIKTAVIVNVVESVTKNSTFISNVDTVTIKSTSAPNVGLASSTSGAMINNSLNLDNLNNGTWEVQSSEISSTMLKDQIEVSTEVQKTDNTNFVMESRCTPTQDLNPDTIDYNELTSKELSASSYVSSSEKYKKSSSSLDVVASLAHYFTSQIHSAGSLQYNLERTPIKKKLPALAPRSLSQQSVPISFKDLKSSPRRQMIASPRKKRLQQHVKTILPKGFVISSFDMSPAKKAASSLVDKAKHLVNSSKGFCQILPRPPNQTISERDSHCSKTKKRRWTKRIESIRKQDISKKSGTYSQSNIKTDHLHGNAKGYNSYKQMSEEDDRCGDTESDYTQSEDDNETQGTDGEDIDNQVTDEWEGTQETDGDSHDSQDEDSHIADLMTASTTIGFVPTREDLCSASRLGKKDRNRDMNLALLKPDIVVTDPQRDLRDTLFAQAYIHKVKKVLRDDVDKLEKFLKIMYNFNRDGTSPIKLYNDLKELFSRQPELIYDFASFLQAGQAHECGCYKAYQEFNSARTFLRKLEIYFMKNPNQLQKVMRTFSRWYKKPGRKESDIREQIEPILKGQKLLLEEFSKFFPNERPGESRMEEFEEVDLDDSGENEDKDASFEEINLSDMEQLYGTKRCPCECHGVGDDTYRKRKKHCYSCCLTVIDGELVYKVNKTTIKKINVTYGPPVKLSILLDEDWSETTTKVVGNIDARPQEPDCVKGIALETENREATCFDWLLDPETVENENFGHFSKETNNEKDGQTQTKTCKGKFSHSKRLFLQRMNKLSRNQPQGKHARLSPIINKKCVSPKLSGDQLCKASKGDHFDQHQNSEPIEIDKVQQLEDEIKGSENNSKINYETTEAMTSLKRSYSLPKENQNDFSPSGILIGSDHAFCKGQITRVSKETEKKQLTEGSQKDNECAVENNKNLASAFNSALNANMSVDSLCFPFNMSTNNTIESTDNASVKLKKSLHDLKNKNNSNVSNNENIKEIVITCEKTLSVSQSVHDIQNNLHVLKNSPFHMEPLSENRKTMSEETSIKDINVLPEENKNIVNDCKEKRLYSSSPCMMSKKDYVLEASKSPPYPLFSPGSPFAQEIQIITSAQSPLTALQSPGVTSLMSSAGKARRIMPIPIKGLEEKTNSQFSFQTAVENSPIIPHFLALSSPCGNTAFQRAKSIEGFTNIPSSSFDNTPVFLSKMENVSTVDFDESQKVKSNSQKSSSNSAESLISATSNSELGLSSISKPDIFSENANVGFPKVTASVTSSSLSHDEILSEESLFHCISKPPQFTETMPSVSNLTNILHALDGHSQGDMLHGHCYADGKIKEHRKNTIENNDANLTEEKQNENFACVYNFAGSEGKGTCEKINSNVQKMYIDIENELPNNTVYGNGFGGNGKNQTVNMYPPSFIDNERMTGELLRIRTLSDNDTGVVSTHNFTEMIIKEKDSGKVNSSGCKSVTERMCESKEKKHKMSRRELKRSLQRKVLNEDENSVHLTVNIASEDKIVSNAHAMVEQNDKVKCKMQLKKENDTHENVNVKEVSSNKLGFASLNEKFNKCESRLGEIKTEESDVLENVCLSDVQSINDTVNEDSSNGHKNAKHSKNKHKSNKDKDNHRRKKRKTENCASDSTQKADERKKRKTKGKLCREKLELSRAVLEHKQSTSRIEKVQELKEDKIVQVSNDKGSDVTGMTGADEMITVNKLEEKREDEPEWSKETDKTILESCKVHGIKEKTFDRIAKEIGNVSVRQVRKRFDLLYQMIFGVQFGGKGNE